MPTPTDLVTDLPADFEVFGQAVDTQMKTNADAATQKATLTTKGDIYAATGTSTPARLALGTNGQVLTVDTSTATGLKYATAAAGGMTQLATGSLSGSSVSITSISGSYKNLYLICTGVSPSSATYPQLLLNSDGSMQTNGIDGQAVLRSYYDGIYPIGKSRNMNPANAQGTFWLTIFDYATTGTQRSFSTQAAYKDNDIGDSASFFTGTWQNTSNAVTSIQIQPFSGTWDAGTYTLYGVS
jgi:hypothetical protein